MSQINSVWQLYLFYVVLIGIGMAGLFVPLLSTIARWFTKRRSTMTGIVTMGLSIGILISAPVANWLISLYQWRMSFVILGIVAFIVVVAAAQLLRRDPAQRQRSSSGDRDGTKQTGGLSLREAVHTRQFWIISCMMFCIGYSLIAIVVHIVPHALDLGFSTVSSANILAAIGGVSILGNVLGGGISDRFGSRTAYLASFLVLAVAIFWLVPSRELWAFSIFAVIFGLGHGGGTPLQSPIVARVFGLKSHGMIFGTTNLMFAIGSSAGPFFTGYLFDVTGNYQMAFIICAGLSVVGMVLAAVLRPLRGQEAKI